MENNQVYTPNRGIFGLLRAGIAGVLLLFVIVLLGSWIFTSVNAGRMIPASEPFPTVAADPAITQTIEIATGNPDFPKITFELETTAAGFIITDVDGDRFACEALPVSMRDLESCQRARG